jgi:hypothetical protein
MLWVSYTQDYIDECRSRMESVLPHKVQVTRKQEPVMRFLFSAVASFEPLFFDNLALEGKDGNPLAPSEKCLDAMALYSRARCSLQKAAANLIYFGIQTAMRPLSDYSVRLARSSFATAVSTFLNRWFSAAPFRALCQSQTLEQKQ